MPPPGPLFVSHVGRGKDAMIIYENMNKNGFGKRSWTAKLPPIMSDTTWFWTKKDAEARQ